MKNFINSISILLLAVTFISCQDKYTETYTANVPEYISFDAWRAMNITVESPRAVSDAGKIYIYQNYLFVVSRGQGVHIIDNTQPSSPQNIAFLSVLGCVDVAVRNNSLYIDSYSDLLSFDITDPKNPIQSCRIVDAFDYGNGSFLRSFDENLPIAGIDRSKGIIVGWKQVEVSIDTDPYTNFDAATFQTIDNVGSIANGIGSNNSTGIGGSMAQFTITGNYLYVLRPASITAFDLSAEVCPQQSAATATNGNAETIFPYNDHLFLGTTSGMLIYNLNNPSTPQLVSEISHLTACDPVVVNGNRAYVTIRTGTQCQGFLNQLLVIDITDYAAPYTLAEYDLTNPHGLGIDANTLFICDGSDGLKVYNAEDDMDILNNQISHYPGINTFDVIPYNDVLIMSAEEGIYQYDYSNPLSISQLSFIPSN